MKAVKMVLLKVKWCFSYWPAIGQALQSVHDTVNNYINKNILLGFWHFKKRVHVVWQTVFVSLKMLSSAGIPRCKSSQF